MIEYTFDEDTDVHQIRLIFDNDMNRKYHNMPCSYPLVEKRFKLPQTLIREYRLVGTDAVGNSYEIHVNDSHQRFVTHQVNWRISKLCFIPIATHGCEQFRLFDFEIS